MTQCQIAPSRENSLVHNPQHLSADRSTSSSTSTTPTHNTVFYDFKRPYLVRLDTHTSAQAVMTLWYLCVGLRAI